MNDKERPTEPVVDDKGRTHGGFSGVAGVLNTLFPNRRRPISRQLVHKWWIFRHDNEFPEAISMVGSTNGGLGRPEFTYADAVAWYQDKRQHRDERRYALSRDALPEPTTTETGKNTLAA